VALFEKGETEEAIKEYREAIRLKPDYAEAHYGLGWALDQKGERKEARGYFERAVKLEKKPELGEWIKKRLAEPD
jgi:Flp pilus assembly protein TadD